MRGLDAIPTVLPAIRPQPPRDTGVIESRVRGAAVALGLSEAITYGFVSPKDLESVGAPASPVVLKNPLSDERSVMRTSLLPGLARSGARGRGDTAKPKRGSSRSARSSLRELRSMVCRARFPRFAAVLAGQRHGYLTKPEHFDVYDAKGVGVDIAERVAGRSGACGRPGWRQARSASSSARCRRRSRGYRARRTDWARCTPTCFALGISTSPAWWWSSSISPRSRVLARRARASCRSLGCLRPPAISRWSFTTTLQPVQVEQLIREAAGDLCESVEVFDVFRGASVPADHRSLAFHVVYRDPRATTAPYRGSHAHRSRGRRATRRGGRQGESRIRRDAAGVARRQSPTSPSSARLIPRSGISDDARGASRRQVIDRRLPSRPCRCRTRRPFQRRLLAPGGVALVPPATSANWASDNSSSKPVSGARSAVAFWRSFGSR